MIFSSSSRERRGYDLTPYLAVLSQPGYNYPYRLYPGVLPLFSVSGGDAIRADYWKTVSELIFERFYHPFDEWASNTNCSRACRRTALLAICSRFTAMRAFRRPRNSPADNTVNFMKLASSAGYDYGRRIVSSESFIFEGNPYGTTPETIKANSDKLLISGINEIIYHGFPYKFDEGPKGIGWFPFPGWYSSQINEANPIWPFIGTVNAYITRLQYIAQAGASDLQVAIFRSSLSEDDTGPSPASGAVPDPFPAIEKALTSSGLSFGFVNEDALLGGNASDSALSTRGGGHYRALVIPHETDVSPELVNEAEILCQCAGAHRFCGRLARSKREFQHTEARQRAG